MLRNIFFVVIFILTPLAMAQESSAKATSKIPMRLSWNKLEGVESYNVTISRFDDFQESRSFKTKKSFLSIMVFPDSHYFWKISAVNDDERMINQKKIYEFQSKAGQVAKASLELDQVEKQIESEPVKSAPPVEQVKIVPPPPQPMEVIPPMERAAPSDPLKQYEVNVATELGFLSFTQDHTTFGSVKANGVLFPSLALSLQTPFYAETVAFAFYFQQVIGNFNADTGSVSLIDKDFQWLRFGGKAYLNISGGENWKIHPYVGVEQFKTPFFFTLSPTEMDIKELKYLNALVGVYIIKKGENGWAYFADVNYSLPVQQSGEDLTSIDTQSSLIIDASLGFKRTLKNDIYIGSSLKTSVRNLNENLETATSQSNGSRKMLYFGIDFNAGVSF